MAMLTDQEIEHLASDMESDRVERKESLSGGAKDKIAQAICAYANDLPSHGSAGLILVGMTDAGIPTGLPITDELLLTLGAIRSDGNILPLPTLVVQKVVLKGKEVAAVTVAPSSDTPVRYEGRVWIRVGPRRAIASRDEERILVEKRQSGDLPFDRRPVQGASIEELDLEFFRSTYLPSAVSPEVLAENERSIRDQLLALHLLSPSNEPNYASMLLLGRDPRAHIPSAYVQFVRFDGTDLLSPIIDQKELSGRLSDVLLRTEDLAALNIRTETVVEGHIAEQRRPDYPLPALQQLIRNAIMHRSYEIHAPVHWYWFSDRVEIHSPGGLYGRVTEANFGKAGVGATDYRNQVVAEGLKVMGYVQRFGMGLEIARRRCIENGNGEPSYEFSHSALVAIVRSRK
jgi:ATP-dependent DNA helicase RecG